MSRAISSISPYADPTVTSPRAVLIGAPGSGKSTVGSALAERWDVEFRDSDVDIERRTGRSISDIFVDEGEAAFRSLEAVAVEDALGQCAGVVALGGGAITSETIRELLRAHRVVWLRVGLTAAAARVGLSRDRPLLVGNVRSTLLRLMQQRAPWYESVASLTVDTDDKDIDAVVDEIVLGLGEGP